MEPEYSLPHSQVPATCPYPEPTLSSPHNPTTHFLKFKCITISGPKFTQVKEVEKSSSFMCSIRQTKI